MPAQPLPSYGPNLVSFSRNVLLPPARGAIGAFAPAIVQVTRPADTSLYSANDVIGAATDATAALTFNLGVGEVLITGTEFEIDASALIGSEAAYRLHLYNVAPPSALADNAAWDLPSGDRSAYLGHLDLGTPVDLGATLYVQANNVNKPITLIGANVYGYLTTIASYQPTSGRVYKITLHGERH